MPWSDYAYNPYKSSGFRKFVRPYVNSGFKQLGLSTKYVDRGMNMASRFNQAKGNFIRKAGARVMSAVSGNKRSRTSYPTRVGSKKPKTRRRVFRKGRFPSFSNNMAFKYQGKRGKRISQINKFSAYGSENLIECRGVSDAQPDGIGDEKASTKADFGHYSSPYSMLHQEIFKCFVRMLAHANGTDIKDWYVTASQHFIEAGTATHALSLGIRRQINEPTTYVQIALDSTTESVHSLGNRWLVAYQSYVASTNDQSDFHLVYIDYHENVAPYRSLARINLVDAKVVVKTSSTMKMQNRTRGVSSSDDAMTDVTNNPLRCMAVDLRGNTVTFRNYNETLESGPNRAHNYTGFIEAWMKDLTNGAPDPNPRDIQHATGVKRHVIEPGHFFTSRISYNRLMKLDAYFNLGRDVHRNTDSRIAFGVSRVFNFDKFLDTSSGDQLPSVGWQLNQYTGVRILKGIPSVKRYFTNSGKVTDANTQGI